MRSAFAHNDGCIAISGSQWKLDGRPFIFSVRNVWIRAMTRNDVQ